MKYIILYRDDIASTLHPNLWESICDDLGLAPSCPSCGEYPDSIELSVATATDGSISPPVVVDTFNNATGWKRTND